jgi:hypothetical protein
MTLTLKNVKIVINDNGPSIIFKLYLVNLNLYNVEISPSSNQIVQKETSIFVITDDYKQIPRIKVYQLIIERINFVGIYILDLTQAE